MKSWAEIAKNIAIKAHKGQVDKGGNAYILHPMRVASEMQSDTAKAVAWLHDVVEDTFITLDDLEAVFPAEITQAVDAITKRPKESYNEYLTRVVANDTAYVVKLEDMRHNADVSRIPNPSERDFIRCKSYENRQRALIQMYRERSKYGLGNQS